jgi:hypothetical protein
MRREQARSTGLGPAKGVLQLQHVGNPRQQFFTTMMRTGLANHCRTSAANTLSGSGHATNNQTAPKQTTLDAAIPGQVLPPRDELKKTSSGRWN